jgi:hypothetical protein
MRTPTIDAMLWSETRRDVLAVHEHSPQPVGLVDCVLIGDSIDNAHAAPVVGARVVLYAGGFTEESRLRATGLPVAASLTEVIALAAAGGAPNAAGSERATDSAASAPGRSHHLQATRWPSRTKRGTPESRWSQHGDGRADRADRLVPSRPV